MLEHDTQVLAELGELLAGESLSIVGQDLKRYSIPYEELLSQELNYGFGFCVRDRKNLTHPVNRSLIVKMCLCPSIAGVKGPT